MTTCSLDILLSKFWTQSVVPCKVLTFESWPECRFLRRQVRYSGIPNSKNFPQFVVIHTVIKHNQWSRSRFFFFFLECPCFLRDPTNVGTLISSSSTFSKPSLYIWRFLAHTLLNPSLKDFEHWHAKCEINTTVLQFGYSLALSFFWIEMKTDFVYFCDHCWVFQIFGHAECSTLTA